ncbi:E3 ubiquitin-protein ligase Iruka isoform X2 [Rhodnius prolixus]|uniref:E3 ubiquitin-protein ligase Iruka isoform X2 n=1 Tax=Rhodnius prolixus TaxID=13249 RepID=UPI003D18D82D
MADEAAVENLPVSRFFCHKCSREIAIVLPDYKCPNCQSGFIEALENAPEQHDESDSELEVQSFELLHEVLNGLEERRGGRGRRSGRAGRARQMYEPMETILQDFMMNLGVGWGAMGSNTIGVGTGRGGGGPVLLLGNPGDYAWGREGLDAIVTQLLNQMDTTGPPPLAKDKINQIPVVIITKEQADTNLQCSVCWEDFKIDEPVRKLPCEHVYHENCIIPWLELHGTCPICRKTLTEDGRVEDPDNSSNVVGNSLATLFRYATEGGNTRASSSASSGGSVSSRGGSVTTAPASSTTGPSSTSSSSTSSTSSTSSSSSSRPDFHMDIDFD